MSIEIPEKCPKCRSKRQPCLNAVVVQFQCGSIVDVGDGEWLDETSHCVILQRDLLTKRVAELEEALRLIANMDYRGNRSTESLVALNALKKSS
jgi:hypothetical protein